MVSGSGRKVNPGAAARLNSIDPRHLLIADSHRDAFDSDTRRNGA